MPDASPLKWHLAHTTWFFETFVLGRDADYRALRPEFRDLFNSYYNAVGEQFPRSHMRASYRNFFPSHARWQFSGIRLARDPG